MSDSSSVPSTPSTLSTPDISIGSTAGSSASSRLVISVVGEKFIPNGHSISKAITETFKKRQDATGYSWKDKVYMWNPTANAIIECTWSKVASTLYSKKMYLCKKCTNKPNFIAEDVWKSWKAHWATDEWLDKYRITTQNRCSETCVQALAQANILWVLGQQWSIL